MSLSKLLVSTLALAALGLSGCWSSDSKTVEVTGLILYHGRPVAGAEVSFISRERKLEEGEHPPRGLTDSSGHFRLTTRISEEETVDGAVPGNYVATVLKLNIVTGSNEESLKTIGGNRDQKKESEIPSYYYDPDLSGLKFHVMSQEEIDKVEEELANQTDGESQGPRKQQMVEVDGVKGFVHPDSRSDPLEEEGGPLYVSHKYSTAHGHNDFILVLTDTPLMTE